MKLLITGGAGYIGSVVTAELVQLGHDVVVFDNLCKGHCAAIAAGARFVRGDVSDRAALASVFRANAFDGVLHFAAFIEAGESMEVPEKYFRNNTANALTLLETVLSFKVPRSVSGIDFLEGIKDHRIDYWHFELRLVYGKVLPFGRFGPSAVVATVAT